MSITRDNHFVPQVYLRNFADGSGNVREYRTLVAHESIPLWKSVNVSGTGYEQNLYTRIVQGEEKDDIEQWLDHEFESPAGEVFQKIQSDNELNNDDWKVLVRFLAAQIVRTPAFLLKNLLIWNRMAPNVLKEAMKEVESKLREVKENGREISINNFPHKEYSPIHVEQQELPEEGKVEIEVKTLVGRRLWFFAMKHMLTQTLDVLYKHTWTILEAPIGYEWFTSDDPVICLNYRSESDYDFGGGWNRLNENIFLRLTPNHMIFTEIGATGYRRTIAKKYHARLLRRFIAEHAHRKIYAFQADGKIPQLRSRIVNATQFNYERALWSTWYEAQNEAEKHLKGHRSDHEGTKPFEG